MKTKIFLLLFAGACTVLSLVITQNYVKDKLKETQVVVFRQDIQPFTQLTEEMLEIKQVGVNGLHAQASASIDEVKGLFLDSKAVKGEVALKSKLYRKEQLAKGYLFQMKPDERVIAVTTDLSRSAGGTVCSGDYVDLIAVVDEKSGMEPIAKTFVQHVKVLDVRDEGARKLSDSDSQPKKDQQSQVISGSNRKLVPHAVLLAVTPQQAEQIVLYQKLGEITLSVNPQGSKAFTSGGVRLSSLGM